MRLQRAFLIVATLRIALAGYADLPVALLGKLSLTGSWLAELAMMKPAVQVNGALT